MNIEYLFIVLSQAGWMQFPVQLKHIHTSYPLLHLHCISLFQEKIEKANNEREEKGRKMRGKRHKLTLTPATSHSKIPSRWQEEDITQSLHIPRSKSQGRQGTNLLQKCRSDSSLTRYSRTQLRPVLGGDF